MDMGRLGLRRGTVELVPHAPSWETIAARTVEWLKMLFGPVARGVQHVGSTAIRTIAAKPILDIAVAVDELDDVLPLLPHLAEHGVTHRPQNDDENQRFFVCGDLSQDMVTHHIHVVRADGMEWRNYGNFRDYLNAHPAKAAAYEQLKRELAAAHPGDRAAYTAGKVEFIRHTLRKALVWSFLGQTVTVNIDRPVGYVHQKGGYTLTYPINYGYIPGVLGGDGEELDVYVLGPTEPLATFTGRVIGIVHRENDVEDKLVAAPEGVRMDQAEIAAAVAFQERWYHSYAQALYPTSCGAIVYRRGKFLVLLQRGSHTWSIPKGHREPGETPQQTAMREVWEETGLAVSLCADFGVEVQYPLPAVPGSQKTVVLFLAVDTDGELTLREEEICEARWVTAGEAKQLLHPAYTPAIEAAEAHMSRA